MKITVAKSDLEKGLKAAQISIGSGGDLQSHYVVRIHDGRAEILTQNGFSCIKAPLTGCTVEGAEGSILTIEASRLDRWLGGIDNDAIDIMTLDDGDVRLKSQSSTIEFPTLDASKFVAWDATLAAATKTAELPATRLSTALAYVRQFIADNTDTTRPEIGLTEVRNGVMWATDRKSMTLVTLDVLENAKFRIVGKEIAAVTKFLEQDPTGIVEILEHDRQMFLRRVDGVVFGVRRPLAEFPGLNVDRNTPDPIRWEVRIQDLLRGIQCISAAAEDPAHPRIRFGYDNGQVILSVTSAKGKRIIAPIEAMDVAGVDQLPDDGFVIDNTYIDKVVKMFGGDTIKFGIHRKDNGGYVRFRNTPKDSTDDYLTVVVWRV